MKKRLSPKEKLFSHLLAEGMSGTNAARKAFGWRCESGTKEAQKARDLARSPRVKREIDKYGEQRLKEAEAVRDIDNVPAFDLDNLSVFVYERLVDPSSSRC